MGGNSTEQQANQTSPQDESAPSGPAVKSKVTAGILGIVLGWIGIHRFYLGYNTIGIIMVLVWVVGVILSVITCGIGSFIPAGVATWGLVEGIQILVGKSPFDKDAQGRPLKD